MQITSEPNLRILKKMCKRHLFQLEQENDRLFNEEDVPTNVFEEIEKEKKHTTELLEAAERELTNKHT